MDTTPTLQPATGGFKSRLNAARSRYRTDGFVPLMMSVLWRIRARFLRRNVYSRIASTLTSDLYSEQATIEVCTRLSRGVHYIVGMGVEGDVAEFGTMTGRSAVALAVSLNHLSRSLRDSDAALGFRERRLWLFDSFEGLPEPRFDTDRRSPHVASGIWREHACKGLNRDQLKALVSRYIPSDRVDILEGWFKDTVQTIPPAARFALVHIDGDLYESAIDVLDYLFGHGMIQQGAMLYFDDWNCNHADPEMGERRAFAEVVRKYGVGYSDAGSYGIACQRFVIHQYSFGPARTNSATVDRTDFQSRRLD